jgi:hypothetical protein
VSLWQTMRAWAAVHATRSAFSIMAVVAPTSLFLAQSEVQDFGLVRLISPVSVLLLMPALTGIAAAMACENTVSLALPDPMRAVLSRAAWAAGWTGVALATVCIAGATQGATSLMAITRNVLLFTAISLFTLRLGYPHLLWLPVMAYMIACMLFGYGRPSHEYYWWAAVMEADVRGGQLGASCLLFGVAMLVYVVPWFRRSRGPFRF